MSSGLRSCLRRILLRPRRFPMLHMDSTRSCTCSSDSDGSCRRSRHIRRQEPISTGAHSRHCDAATASAISLCDVLRTLSSLHCTCPPPYPASTSRRSSRSLLSLLSAARRMAPLLSGSDCNPGASISSSAMTASFNCQDQTRQEDRVGHHLACMFVVVPTCCTLTSSATLQRKQRGRLQLVLHND